MLLTVESFYNLCKSEAENIRRYFKQKRTKYQTHESRTGSATMKASSEVYTGKVNTMSDITNRSLTLSSTTHTMSTGSIVYNNTGLRRWYISGEIKKVTYEMVAYTSLKAVLNVTGIISR